MAARCRSKVSPSKATSLPTGKLFPIAVQEARFDITELSVSSYVLQVSRGECAYTAIPAFVSRAFRHSGFYARTGSEIETLSDLRGKRVGVPEYQMTAALWMRGLLADEAWRGSGRYHLATGALDAGVYRGTVMRQRTAPVTPPS